MTATGAVYRGAMVQFNGIADGMGDLFDQEFHYTVIAERE